MSVLSLVQDRGDDDCRTTCRIIAEVFALITAVPNVDAADAETIAMETLFDAHHPIIGLYYSLLVYSVALLPAMSAAKAKQSVALILFVCLFVSSLCFQLTDL